MQSFGPTVRRATQSDYDGVMVLARSFGTAGTVTTTDTAATFSRLVADPDVFLAVAVGGTELVGYVLAQDYLPGLRSGFAAGRINDLFVEPAARKVGVGRALMNAVVQWANERPHPIILDWQAPAKSAGFYQALGYVPDYVGDIADYPEFTIDTRSGVANE